MNHKIPVVSTNEGGIPDIVKDGENGFICERNDVVSLAEALEKLISSKNLRIEMGVKSYDIYNNNFTLTTFEKKMNQILHL